MEIQRLEKMSKQVRLKPNYVWKNLHRLLCSEELWIMAYERQKSNTGSLTPVMDPNDTMQGVSLERIRNTILLFKKDNWKPQIARQIQIPKPKKKQTRPLGIQGEMNKLAPGVVLLILQALYEPIFRETSYGFRPSVGTHDALQCIGRNFNGITTVLEGNIKTCYPSIHHSILIKILKRRISDNRFLDVIQKMLKAGIWDIEPHKLLTSNRGTPQGSIVSPILANIYLHEMDLFIEEWYKTNLIPLKFKKNAKPRLSATSVDVRSEILNLQKSQNPNIEENRSLKLKKLGMVVTAPESITPKLIYVRYANDFLIGTNLDPHTVVKLKDDLTTFLKKTLALTLNQEKSKIVDMHKKICVFLGYNIRVNAYKRLFLIKPNNKSSYLKRTTGYFVKLEIPIQNVINRLSQKGFCTGSGKPLSIGRLTAYDDQDIVRYGSALLRSILNYYALSVSTVYKHRIRYIIKFSLLHTFAHKYKTTVRKMHLKLGPDIDVEYKTINNKSNTLRKHVKLDKVNSARIWKMGAKFKNIYSGYLGKYTKTR
jgi:group II intron reverse transcriptase/maturase